MKKRLNRLKRGIAIDKLTWWLIALAILAVVLVFSYILKDKLIASIPFIKNLFR